jgi:hypothetical protein
MSVNIPNGHKIYQHFPIKGPPKFTQIWIFGLKRNHLATLVSAAAESAKRHIRFTQVRAWACQRSRTTKRPQPSTAFVFEQPQPCGATYWLRGVLLNSGWAWTSFVLLWAQFY